MSCSESEELINDASKKENEHTLTPAEASSNVLEFISKMNTSSRSTTPATIADVQPFILPSDIASRASVQCPDTLFYVVNFANDKGFAIAGADDRDPEIYAIVEDGTFSYNDSTAVGFNMFLSNLINMKLFNTMSENPDDTDDHPGENPDDPDTERDGDRVGGNGPHPEDNHDFFDVMSPLLKTKWGQQYFYNIFCPNEYKTGCVPTAIAQIFSYLESPNYVTYCKNGESMSAYLDWDTINYECETNNGVPSSPLIQRNIAVLMRYLGVIFESDYEADITETCLEDALDVLQEGHMNVTNLRDYNINNVIQDLNDGNKIIIIRGYTNKHHILFAIPIYSGGHTWVVDGYIRERQNGELTKYLHCNWGDNGDNIGYFLSTVLDAGITPSYRDNVSSRSESHVKYKIETATFTKQ